MFQGPDQSIGFAGVFAARHQLVTVSADFDSALLPGTGLVYVANCAVDILESILGGGEPMLPR
jgi:hypothetical protein